LADYVSAQVSNGVNAAGAGATGVAMLGAAAAAMWAIIGWWLGRQHETQLKSVPGEVASHGAAPEEARVV
jgi:AAA family ATP:ADP antiporter